MKITLETESHECMLENASPPSYVYCGTVFLPNTGAQAQTVPGPDLPMRLRHALAAKRGEGEETCLLHVIYDSSWFKKPEM